MDELILRIAWTAGQNGKILPSRLSNTGEFNFNIIMFSNQECPVPAASGPPHEGISTPENTTVRCLIVSESLI